MDLSYFVGERLRFAEYFFEHTVSVFEAIARQIETGEPPYVDTRNPEYADEPAFQADWERADEAINIAGAACLQILQSTLRLFLDEYMKQVGLGSMIQQASSKSGEKGWFRNYKAFFENRLDIDWDASGADTDLLEQVNLTRNDFFHGARLTSLSTMQGATHAEKQSDSAFTDPNWPCSILIGKRLAVRRDNVESAVTAVRQLCDYLDGEQRSQLIRRLSVARAARKAQKTDVSGA